MLYVHGRYNDINFVVYSVRTINRGIARFTNREQFRGFNSNGHLHY